MEETAKITRVVVSHVSVNISEDGLRSFLRMDVSPLHRQAAFSRVQSESGKQSYSAIFNCPEELVQGLLTFNGAELDGRTISVGCVETSTNSSNNVADNEEGSSANSDNNNSSLEIVQLDFSHAKDVYQYRDLSRVEVVQAVRHTFGDDESRRLVPPRQRDDTRWVIETDNIDLYKNVAVVKDGGENEVATVDIKTTVITHTEKGTRTRYVRSGGGGRQEGDLLLTLVGADTRRFRHVTNTELTKLVVDLGIGRIKRAVQMQPIRGTSEPSGNKYVILENVTDEAKKRIPPAFDFGQSGRMWINFYGKPRKCYFCNEFHEATVSMCPTEVIVRAMEQERAQTPKRIKTYSDSTMRLVRETALTGDVDAMSGGTTGNVLNAVDIDTKAANVESVLIVAGQNELHRRMTNEEFVWVNMKNEERLQKLGAAKKVVVLAPPHQDFYDHEAQAREELARASREKLAEAGHILLWENPMGDYEDDAGRHPSDDQTKRIVSYLDVKYREELSIPYVLESATAEVLTARRYAGVSALYRFGCAGCNSRERNKWQNLCDTCKSSLAADPVVKESTAKLMERIKDIYDASNPEFPTDTVMEDVEEGTAEAVVVLDEPLVCEVCNITFQSGQEIRDHFSERHQDMVLVQLPSRKKKKRSPKSDDQNDRTKLPKNK